jgi:hypothetical protein
LSETRPGAGSAVSAEVKVTGDLADCCKHADTKKPRQEKMSTAFNICFERDASLIALSVIRDGFQV